MSERAVVPGEVVGWRAWHLLEKANEPLRLASPVSGHDDQVAVWPFDRWAMARCDHGCEEIPGEKCGCGLYAVKSRALVPRHLRNAEVWGEIALAGKVIPGDDGYRAERARPVRLYLPFDCWEQAAELRDAYGVPVELGSRFYETEEVEL